MRTVLEVIASTIDDAIAAEAGGADRIELVSNILEGGTTPSSGLIRAVKCAVRIPVYVMIRPRGGGFVFSDREIEAMVADARVARELGADGVVTGVLQPDGTIDTQVTGRIAEAASLPTTFHRAIDCVHDILAGVKELSRIPLVERVLTSGGHPSVYDGRAIVAQLCRISPVEVMPGAGVTRENVCEIIRETGARAIHVGSAAREQSTATAPVSTDRVSALRDILDAV